MRALESVWLQLLNAKMNKNDLQLLHGLLRAMAKKKTDRVTLSQRDLSLLSGLTRRTLRESLSRVNGTVVAIEQPHEYHAGQTITLIHGSKPCLN